MLEVRLADVPDDVKVVGTEGGTVTPLSGDARFAGLVHAADDDVDATLDCWIDAAGRILDALAVRTGYGDRHDLMDGDSADPWVAALRGAPGEAR